MIFATFSAAATGCVSAACAEFAVVQCSRRPTNFPISGRFTPPMTAWLEALRRRQAAFTRGEALAAEATLAGSVVLGLMKAARQAGYRFVRRICARRRPGGAPDTGTGVRPAATASRKRTCGGGEHGHPRSCRLRSCGRVRCCPAATPTPRCRAAAVFGEGEWSADRLPTGTAAAIAPAAPNP